VSVVDPQDAGAGDPVARIGAAARVATTSCGAGRITWRSWGDGTPVLLVHGGFGSWLHWIRNIEALATRHCVIAVDLPGLGDSTEAPPPHTAEAIAELLADGLESVVAGVSPLVIVGFSLGGAIACALAARLAARARQLILLCPTGIGQLWQTIDGLPRRRAGMPDDELTALARATLERTLIADPSQIDPLALGIQRTLLGRKRYLNGTAIAATDITLSTLAALHPATRAAIIWGGSDAFLRDGAHGSVAIVRARVPGIDIRIVEGAGHWVQYEAAAAVNAMLVALAAHAADPRAGAAPPRAATREPAT